MIKRKQKISIVLARTQNDPMTASSWQEIKIVDIEVDDDGNGEWHVIGGNTTIIEEIDQKSEYDRCREVGCAMCYYGDLPYCEPERARRAYMPKL